MVKANIQSLNCWNVVITSYSIHYTKLYDRHACLFPRSGAPGDTQGFVMSEARKSFETGIRDAEILLQHFDSINTRPPPENAEVLKRAGLIIALTAWESYNFV